MAAMSGACTALRIMAVAAYQPCSFGSLSAPSSLIQMRRLAACILAQVDMSPDGPYSLSSQQLCLALAQADSAAWESVVTHARQSAQAVAAADASLQWLTHESDDALVVRALADGDVLHGMACGNEGGVGLRLDVTSLERAASRAAVDLVPLDLVPEAFISQSLAPPADDAAVGTDAGNTSSVRDQGEAARSAPPTDLPSIPVPSAITQHTTPLEPPALPVAPPAHMPPPPPRHMMAHAAAMQALRAGGGGVGEVGGEPRSGGGRASADGGGGGSGGVTGGRGGDERQLLCGWARAVYTQNTPAARLKLAMIKYLVESPEAARGPLGSLSMLASEASRVLHQLLPADCDAIPPPMTKVLFVEDSMWLTKPVGPPGSRPLAYAVRLLVPRLRSAALRVEDRAAGSTAHSKGDAASASAPPAHPAGAPSGAYRPQDSHAAAAADAAAAALSPARPTGATPSGRPGSGMGTATATAMDAGMVGARPSALQGYADIVYPPTTPANRLKGLLIRQMSIRYMTTSRSDDPVPALTMLGTHMGIYLNKHAKQDWTQILPPRLKSLMERSEDACWDVVTEGANVLVRLNIPELMRAAGVELPPPTPTSAAQGLTSPRHPGGGMQQQPGPTHTAPAATNKLDPASAAAAAAVAAALPAPASAQGAHAPGGGSAPPRTPTPPPGAAPSVTQLHAAAAAVYSATDPLTTLAKVAAQTLASRLMGPLGPHSMRGQELGVVLAQKAHAAWGSLQGAKMKSAFGNADGFLFLERYQGNVALRLDAQALMKAAEGAGPHALDADDARGDGHSQGHSSKAAPIGPPSPSRSALSNSSGALNTNPEGDRGRTIASPFQAAAGGAPAGAATAAHAPLSHRPTPSPRIALAAACMSVWWPHSLPLLVAGLTLVTHPEAETSHNGGSGGGSWRGEVVSLPQPVLVDQVLRVCRQAGQPVAKAALAVQKVLVLKLLMTAEPVLVATSGRVVLNIGELCARVVAAATHSESSSVTGGTAPMWPPTTRHLPVDAFHPMLASTLKQLHARMTVGHPADNQQFLAACLSLISARSNGVAPSPAAQLPVSAGDADARTTAATAAPSSRAPASASVGDISGGGSSNSVGGGPQPGGASACGTSSQDVRANASTPAASAPAAPRTATNNNNVNAASTTGNASTAPSAPSAPAVAIPALWAPPSRSPQTQPLDAAAMQRLNSVGALTALAPGHLSPSPSMPVPLPLPMVGGVAMTRSSGNLMGLSQAQMRMGGAMQLRGHGRGGEGDGLGDADVAVMRAGLGVGSRVGGNEEDLMSLLVGALDL